MVLFRHGLGPGPLEESDKGALAGSEKILAIPGSAESCAHLEPEQVAPVADRPVERGRHERQVVDAGHAHHDPSYPDCLFDTDLFRGIEQIHLAVVAAVLEELLSEQLQPLPKSRSSATLVFLASATKAVGSNTLARNGNAMVFFHGKSFPSCGRTYPRSPRPVCE